MNAIAYKSYVKCEESAAKIRGILIQQHTTAEDIDTLNRESGFLSLMLTKIQTSPEGQGMDFTALFDTVNNAVSAINSIK